MAEIPINYLKYIDQDGTEKKVYPITVTDAVYDSDGNKLSNVLLGVLKDTDISNVQSDSTTTVPSSALLKSTDDKIGDTSSLPGDAGNVVSAINQLNSDMQVVRVTNTSFENYMDTFPDNTFRVIRTNNTVTGTPTEYLEGLAIKIDNNKVAILANMITGELFVWHKNSAGDNVSWDKFQSTKVTLNN